MPFCLSLKNKLKQQEKQHRRQESLLMKRRMAIMTASVNPGQSGPHTPAAADHAPATPKQPGTPGSMAGGPGTPNTGQMGSNKPMGPSMMSPSGGKGVPQVMNRQNGPVVGGQIAQGGMSMPQSPQIQVQQHQAQQQSQQAQQAYNNPQMGMLSPQSNVPSTFANSRTQMNYAQPPERAVWAAKQAQIVARVQATNAPRPAMNIRGANPAMRQMTPQNMPTGQWPNQTRTSNDFAQRQNQMPNQMPGTIINQTVPKIESEKLKQLIAQNPRLTAHVIQQNRQQRQQQQQHAIVSVCSEVVKFSDQKSKS